MAQQPTTDKTSSLANKFADALLAWYDRNARELPWRVSPADRKAGIAPDPYRVWLSEVMLQQTTVATVRDRYTAFLERWPTVQDLADAPLDEVLGEWAGLGYYARARNLHACANAVAQDHGGGFPETAAALQALPGIGPYTASAIAAIAFDEPAPVVDGNVDRVIVRQMAFDQPIREMKPAIYEEAARRTPRHRPGDYAQAMMDLGATICRPKGADCLLCPVREGCRAHQTGQANLLPKKPPKKKKPTRLGTVYLIRDGGGQILCQTRPDRGLLGGMTGLPGGEWAQDILPPASSPLGGEGEEAGEVTHTFTHFHLVLRVRLVAASGEAPPDFFWLSPDRVDTLPTVFRKVVESGR